MEGKYFRPWLCPEKEVKFPIRPIALLPWCVVLQRMQNSLKKKHRCSFCSSAFANYYHLKVHIRKHTGEKPHICEVCRRPFTRKEELTRHKMIHSGEKRFTCIVCNKKFYRRDHLRKHVSSMHSDTKIQPEKARYSETAPYLNSLG